MYETNKGDYIITNVYTKEFVYDEFKNLKQTQRK